MSSKFDVAIVGASLAGSTLARALTDSGHKVVLFDSCSFPRRKPCGEGLSHRAFPYLKHFGVLNAVQALPHSKLRGYEIRFASHGGKFATASFEAGAEGLIGIERLRLDGFLAERAQIGLYAAFNQTVRKIEQDAHGVVVHTDRSSFNSRFVVLADGSRSACAATCGIKLSRPAALRFGVSALVEGVYREPPDRVQIVLHRDCQIFFTPLQGAAANFSILSSKQNAKAALSLEFFQTALREFGRESGFDGKQASELLSIGPIEQRREAHRGRIILVGDCVEALDPIAGMGMTHAFLSAKLAAEALQIAASSDGYEEAFANYALRRNREAAPLRRITSLIKFFLLRAPRLTLGVGQLKNRLSPPLLSTAEQC